MFNKEETLSFLVELLAINSPLVIPDMPLILSKQQSSHSVMKQLKRLKGI